MYIIAIGGREDEGAYSVRDEYGDQFLYIFQEEDDAIRFSMMLEDMGSPKMNVIDVEEEILIEACETYGHQYVIFTPDDIVIPPKETAKNDFI